jgi:hypothetical protein
MVDLETSDNSEVELAQAFWSDLLESVLHDSVKHFSYGWDHRRAKDTEQQEILFKPGQDYFDKVQRLSDDQGLLRYVAQSANIFPLTQWKSHSLIGMIMQLHNEYTYWGYHVEFGEDVEDRLICCPIFLVNAILAALYFRIPSGHKNSPQHLSISCYSLERYSDSSAMAITIVTSIPLPDETWNRIHPNTYGGIWDGWHHSWNFARRWASRYGGECQGEIMDRLRLRVSLTLPVA